MALTDAIPRVSRALAWLEVERSEGEGGYGTAFVAGAAGEILTSAHTLRDARRVRATIVGSKGPVECVVAATDLESDVALLKADARGLTPVTLWRRDSLPVGREVAFVGFPHADLFQPPLIMTMRGIIGNRYRLGRVDYYVVDASASEGMSGGPLFLADTGEVIGIIGGRFDPGRARAKLRGLTREAVRELPTDRTNIVFATMIEAALALLKGRG